MASTLLQRCGLQCCVCGRLDDAADGPHRFVIDSVAVTTLYGTQWRCTTCPDPVMSQQVAEAALHLRARRVYSDVYLDDAS